MVPVYGSYDCVDRIVLNAYHTLWYQPGIKRGYPAADRSVAQRVGQVSRKLLVAAVDFQGEEDVDPFQGLPEHLLGLTQVVRNALGGVAPDERADRGHPQQNRGV